MVQNALTLKTVASTSYNIELIPSTLYSQTQTPCNGPFWHTDLDPVAHDVLDKHDGGLLPGGDFNVPDAVEHGPPQRLLGVKLEVDHRHLPFLLDLLGGLDLVPLGLQGTG